MTVKAQHITARYVKALNDREIDRILSRWEDLFLDEVASKARIDERAAANVLRVHGVDADTVNSLDGGKQADGGFVRALGGLVKKGLWYALIRPFLVLGKVLRSAKFREEVKREFRKALSHDLRATRHLFGVLERMAKGEDVPPPERKAAMKHFINLMVKAVLVVSSATSLGGMSGPLWVVLKRMSLPLQEILIILLNKPFQAAARKLMTAPV